MILFTLFTYVFQLFYYQIRSNFEYVVVEFNSMEMFRTGEVT